MNFPCSFLQHTPTLILCTTYFLTHFFRFNFSKLKAKLYSNSCWAIIFAAWPRGRIERVTASRRPPCFQEEVHRQQLRLRSNRKPRYEERAALGAVFQPDPIYRPPTTGTWPLDGAPAWPDAVSLGAQSCLSADPGGARVTPCSA